jgi:methylated-DNA-[protein]-cysteine S-methyltransferase
LGLEMLALSIATLDSPVGPLLIAADGDGRLRLVHFDPPRDPAALLARACGAPAVDLAWHADPAGCVSALRAYFDGALEAIDALPAAPTGTPFQQEVWQALRIIPSGTTSSYGAIARQLGRPAASRAVGLANGANPVAIVIPCHRVVGSTGALTGYGGGLDRKRWLLAHEARRHRPALF